VTADSGAWLTSAEVRKLLKISTCDLAHLREDSNLRFKKKANAYLYLSADCKRLQKVKYEVSGKVCSIDGQD